MADFKHYLDMKQSFNMKSEVSFEFRYAITSGADLRGPKESERFSSLPQLRCTCEICTIYVSDLFEKLDEDGNIP